MIKKCLLFLFILNLSTISAQEKREFKAYKYELTLTSGYHNPLGVLGAKIGYRPEFLKRSLQFNMGLGFSFFQSIKLSGGIHIYPFKDRLLTPYIGADFSGGLPAYFSSNDGSVQYKIGAHQYINPYFATIIRTKTEQCNFKIKAGYSFLLGNPKINLIRGVPDTYNTILKAINSDFMLVVGISSFF